jgi:tungstate transport system ATP-binding protein
MAEALVLPVTASGIVLARHGRRLLDVPELQFGGTGLTVVLGPNGAGKSLLLRVLAGLVEPDAGTVAWAGRPPDRGRAPRLGFVFQRPVLLRRSARANIVYALKVTGMPAGLRAARADAVLAAARLEAIAASPARLMSGGEQQRLALARALALEPELLFLDEPTTSLDPASTKAIEDMLRTAALAGTRIVLVTHDTAQARRLADEVVFLHQGRVLERADARNFFRKSASREARAYLDGAILA